MKRKIIKCCCLEDGKDGTMEHSKRFSKIIVSNDYSLIQPCTNHIGNYLTSLYWKKFTPKKSKVVK